MVDGQENADANAAEQDQRGLGLMGEAELVGLGASVHPGQGTEHGVDDQVRAAENQEGEGGDGHADRRAQGGQMIIVGRAEAMQVAEMPPEDVGHGYLRSVSCAFVPSALPQKSLPDTRKACFAHCHKGTSCKAGLVGGAAGLQG